MSLKLFQIDVYIEDVIEDFDIPLYDDDPKYIKRFSIDLRTRLKTIVIQKH